MIYVPEKSGAYFVASLATSPHFLPALIPSLSPISLPPRWSVSSLWVGRSLPTCSTYSHELRCQTNGLKLPCGNSLLGALAYFGCDTMSGTEKDEIRLLIIRGGPWTAEERKRI